METATGEKQKRFEHIYERHGLQVLAYCARRLQSADAADAFSETFLVAWRRIDDIPSPPKELPYLYGIAARVVSNQLRTLHRRARLDARLRALGASPPPDPYILAVDRSPNQEVVAAVLRLKRKDREIVMLHAWEDLPSGTIAEMIGMTKAAVDQRIHRSYRRLARVLEATLETSPVHPPPIAKEGEA